MLEEPETNGKPYLNNWLLVFFFNGPWRFTIHRRHAISLDQTKLNWFVHIFSRPAELGSSLRCLCQKGPSHEPRKYSRCCSWPRHSGAAGEQHNLWLLWGDQIIRPYSTRRGSPQRTRLHGGSCRCQLVHCWGSNNQGLLETIDLDSSAKQSFCKYEHECLLFE